MFVFHKHSSLLLNSLNFAKQVYNVWQLPLVFSIIFTHVLFVFLHRIVIYS